MIKYTLIVPLYKSAENLPDLVDAVAKINEQLDSQLLLIAVDDGSPDNAGNLLLSIDCPFPVKVVFHSRNFGAFTAIRTGLEHVETEFVAVMASDLQEPPELVIDFFAGLETGEADVIFGQRVERSDPFLTRVTSTFFWKVYKKLVLPDMPAGGVDIFGCNRRVMDAVLAIEEPNSSLIAQLFWVGFRRKFFAYKRQERMVGKSAWNVSKRFRYMMDSFFSYSDFPILTILWLGVIGCGFSVLFAIATVIARLLGSIDEPGYTTLVLLIIAFGSISIFVQGVLGCYLWRAFENSKHRPLRIISHLKSKD